MGMYDIKGVRSRGRVWQLRRNEMQKRSGKCCNVKLFHDFFV